MKNWLLWKFLTIGISITKNKNDSFPIAPLTTSKKLLIEAQMKKLKPVFFRRVSFNIKEAHTNWFFRITSKWRSQEVLMQQEYFWSINIFTDPGEVRVVEKNDAKS